MGAQCYGRQPAFYMTFQHPTSWSLVWIATCALFRFPVSGTFCFSGDSQHNGRPNKGLPRNVQPIRSLETVTQSPHTWPKRTCRGCLPSSPQMVTRYVQRCQEVRQASNRYCGLKITTQATLILTTKCLRASNCPLVYLNGSQIKRIFRDRRRLLYGLLRCTGEFVILSWRNYSAGEFRTAGTSYAANFLLKACAVKGVCFDYVCERAVPASIAHPDKETRPYVVVP